MYLLTTGNVCSLFWDCAFLHGFVYLLTRARCCRVAIGSLSSLALVSAMSLALVSGMCLLVSAMCLLPTAAE